MNRLLRSLVQCASRFRGSIVGSLVVLPLLSTSPASAQVPTPSSVLGQEVGADFELADWNEALGYFRRLAASSDRLELRDIGYTAEGRPWTIAFISSPANLADLDRIREISQRLAHPAGMTDAFG